MNLTKFQTALRSQVRLLGTVCAGRIIENRKANGHGVSAENPKGSREGVASPLRSAVYALSIGILAGCRTPVQRASYQAVIDAQNAIRQAHAMQAAQPTATFTHYEFQR
jgi:hypothetical protein